MPAAVVAAVPVAKTAVPAGCKLAFIEVQSTAAVLAVVMTPSWNVMGGRVKSHSECSQPA